MMNTINKLLCILGWHDWFWWSSGETVRRCVYCKTVQFKHGDGVYSHWCDRP